MTMISTDGITTEKSSKKSHYLFRTLLLGGACLALAACSGGSGNSSSSGVSGGGSSGSGGSTTTTYTVTATAGANGTISPTTDTVASGATDILAVTPNSGYVISSVSGCGGSLSGDTYTTGAISADCTVTVSFRAREFAWMSGSNTVDATGVYGTKGTAAASNVPGARTGAVSWTDASGRLWLFGGYGYGTSTTYGFLNDLWMYDPSSGQWTWEGGSSGTNAFGVYGTQGTAAASNMPGAREDAVTWTDANGNVWLFGGLGYDDSGLPNYGTLNDLWKYDPSSGQWTWEGGSSSAGASGVYGTQGTAATGNVPGARHSAVRWTDSSGRLWLFGGATSSGNLNDLWMYDLSSGQWTWEGGSSTINASGVYGTQGTAAPSNVPGARYGANSWTDASGRLWLFGGGVSSNYLNDLWMYDPSSSSGQWTWEGGSSTTNASGVYGTQGTAAASNVPGAREHAVSWTDASGKLWLFGGATSTASFNDLWKYDPSSGQWTWEGGSSTAGASGIYGTQGTAATGNVPGARNGATFWTDASGNPWLFGGNGYDASGSNDILNDLWSFD